MPRCGHDRLGELEFDHGELEKALCNGESFWISATCLECERLVEVEYKPGAVKLLKG